MAEPAGRILVVDDEPNICRLLQRYLGRLGYEVETAGSVPEALGILSQREHFDLVLTDLRLPGPSGLDLLVEVRTRAAGTRTILMSAHADVYAAAAAIERGVDQLIVKPFELEDLRERVSDSMSRRQAERNAGYPDGLAGADIPLPARVLAVADTLDAMTSHRAYRRGMAWNEVVAEIHRCSGGQFDPHVVQAFDDALPALERQYMDFARSFSSPPSLVA